MTVASGYAYTYARTSNDTQQASTLEALTDAGAMLAALIWQYWGQRWMLVTHL